MTDNDAVAPALDARHAEALAGAGWRFGFGVRRD